MKALEDIPFGALSLKRLSPAEHEAIIAGFSALCKKSGLDPSPDLWITDSTDQLQAIAYESRFPPAIVVTERLLRAFEGHDQEFITSILSHEIGHILNMEKEEDLRTRILQFRRLFPTLGLAVGAAAGVAWAVSEPLEKAPEKETSIPRRDFLRSVKMKSAVALANVAGGTAIGIRSAQFYENQKRLEIEVAADLTGIGLHGDIASHLAGNTRALSAAHNAGQDVTIAQTADAMLRKILQGRGRAL